MAPFPERIKSLSFPDTFSDVSCNKELQFVVLMKVMSAWEPEFTISAKSALLLHGYRNIFGVPVSRRRESLLCTVLMCFSAASSLNRG